ncbi:G5 domain-containing protein [Actinomyces oricola]|uniref:aggregation-promoting factor C-terminal-like domain-containing protein n=1 Tax=Actinomyces oricola TaxID=206043 RepID=UPI000FFE4187|nr:G5 domain-containing protein [Actinomyces oricola]
MGRHSQSSSLSTTLVELGALASMSRNATTHGRRRAEGPAQTAVTPTLYRAGGVAAALSLAVSGGAYAATQVSGSDIEPLGNGSDAMGAIGSPSPASEESEGLIVQGEALEVSTMTEESTEAYTTVYKETTALAEGETKVETAGVNGVSRTTYQVTSQGGTEISREAISAVTVSARVDEVVLVGTGSTQEVAVASAGDGTTPESAKAVAQAMMASHGWGDDQFSCLVSLWTRESGWNYQAENPSSGAYGIPQALPGSKMSSVASDWATNPVTQITWGLQYIAGRYGSPCSAWAHSESTGWY